MLDTVKNAAVISPPDVSPTNFAGRLRGLDSIRYVCALWVVMGHLGSPFQSMAGHSHWLKLASSLYTAAISGPAAVIVFFVISGLCIHFPYRNGEKLDYFSYYARRYLRIGIPLFVAVGFTQAFLHTFHALSIVELNNSVLWSLVAELIYYTLYPALIFLKRLVGWRTLLLLAFAAAYAVVLSHPQIAATGFYALFGWQMNWIVGLPCWLLGCLLAESLTGSSSQTAAMPQSKYHIWLWRGGVWVASCVTLILQFHQRRGPLHFGYSLTLDLFAVLVYFWLREEIDYFQNHQPVRWLERAGAASYSLYLTHPIVLGFLGNYPLYFGTGALKWLVIVCEIILASALFYFLVERPSHLLARMFRPVRRFAPDLIPASTDRSA